MTPERQRYSDVALSMEVKGTAELQTDGRFTLINLWYELFSLLKTPL